MAKISFLKENTLSHNVTTNDGQTIYPVTTINAVYDTQDRTLKDIINGGYNPENTNIKDNGVYAWLDNLTRRFGLYVQNEYFNILSKDVYDIKSKVDVVSLDVKDTKSLVKSVSTNCSDKINLISKQMYIPVFDSVPTKGSTNLLSSGAMYSYLSKIISKNVLDIKVVDNLDEYKADNGDIVMYGGENTDSYKFGSLYLAKVEYVRNPESICHEKTKKTTWTFLGSMIGECHDTDLSNYYTKAEVNNLIPEVKEYYAGEHIIISDDGYISAEIPETNLSLYYKKTEVDELISNIKVSDVRYAPGDNITIENGVISAVVPDTDGFVTTEYLKRELNKINVTKYTAGNGIQISDGVISAYVNADNFISAESNNAVSNKTVATALSKKLQSEDVARIAMTGKYSDLIDAPQPKTYSIVPGDNVNIETETVGDNTEYKISVESQTESIEDVKVNGNSVVADKIANIVIPSVDVENKNAQLIFGDKSTIANINGTDISVLMPNESETSVSNNNSTLEFGKQSTIGFVNGTELSVVMPQKPKAIVENKNATLSYGQESVIANVDGVDIKVAMPTSTVVPGVDVVNNNANLEFGKTSTIGIVNGTDLTVTMPAKPEQTTVSVNNNNPTLSYGQTATLGSINGTDITLKMPEATEIPLTDVKVNGKSVVEDKVANISINDVSVTDYETTASFGEKTTLANVGGKDITITLPSIPSSGGDTVNVPTVYDSEINIYQGSKHKGSFTLNQSTGASITLDAPNAELYQYTLVLILSNSTYASTQVTVSFMLPFYRDIIPDDLLSVSPSGVGSKLYDKLYLATGVYGDNKDKFVCNIIFFGNGTVQTNGTYQEEWQIQGIHYTEIIKLI